GHLAVVLLPRQGLGRLECFSRLAGESVGIEWHRATSVGQRSAKVDNIAVNFIPGRSAPADPNDGLADGHEVAAVLAVDPLLGLGDVPPGLAHLRTQALDLGGGVLQRGLQLEDALDAREADALV